VKREVVNPLVSAVGLDGTVCSGEAKRHQPIRLSVPGDDAHLQRTPSAKILLLEIMTAVSVDRSWG
jgi:hypothetical protein